ncbi:hypothetical protein F5Y05DRAFT_413749 [Hypoxylon sp. FL0543]|nr:hypothetical protein F5Y05DRAFT_413749 [Hypoxylon sp. FL0543]
MEYLDPDDGPLLGGNQDDDNVPSYINPSSGRDPDNPPLHPGPNVTTIGVEFEFLAAVTKRCRELKDPHPSDGRWQARNLIDYDSNDIKYVITVRNTIIDTLRANGITAVKSAEPSMRFEPTFEFGLADSVEERDPDSHDIPPDAANLDILNWRGSYRWNPVFDEETNVDNAVAHLINQFINYHTSRGLQLHATIDPLLRDISRRILPNYVVGNHEGEFLVPDTFYERARELIEEHKNAHDRQAATQADPDSYDLPFSNPKYRAWACTTDGSVGTYTVEEKHYEIPDGSVQKPPLDKNGRPILTCPVMPPEVYKWFNGELRTPIYDYKSPAAFANIKTACAAIRNAYRIHKPMTAVCTGLHVHFGQVKGWTLLHLKKFATLWLLMERSIETLHRKDRPEEIWCFPLRRRSALAIMTSPVAPDKSYAKHASNMRFRNPLRAYYYMQRMEEHVPTTIGTAFFSQHLKDVINEVWLYDSISGLAAGMSCDGLSGHVGFRVRGGDISQQVYTNQPQTLEFRIMQGTMDAEHIWRWITICYHMVIFARDTSPRQFRDALRRMILKEQPANQILGIPREVIYWFQQHQDEEGNNFIYPDKDKVNWAAPFMARGHGETHDS